MGGGDGTGDNSDSFVGHWSRQSVLDNIMEPKVYQCSMFNVPCESATVVFSISVTVQFTMD